MISSSLNWINVTNLVKELKTGSEGSFDPANSVVSDIDEDETLDKKIISTKVKVKVRVKFREDDGASCSAESSPHGEGSLSGEGSVCGEGSVSSYSSNCDDDFVFKRYDSRRKRIVKSKIVKKKAKDHCISCGDDCVIYDEGAYVCTSCGVVQGALYSTEAETRFYGNDDKKGDQSRTGAPVNELLPTASLMPVISGYGREKYRELHKRYSMKYDERSLLNMINKTKEKLKNSGIPTCIIDKATVYYKLLGQENFKLRSTGDNFMAACILHMCKKKGILKTNQEIADIFNIKGKSMTKGVDSFQELIFRYNPEMMDIVKPTVPEDFIRRYCIDLGLRDGIMREAVHVAEVAKHLGLTKKNIPSSVAVGCIFLVSQTYNYGLTRKIIFKKTHISDVTILKSYQKLLPHKNYLLNKESLKDLDEIVDEYGGERRENGASGTGDEILNKDAYQKKQIILDILKGLDNKDNDDEESIEEATA